MKANIFVMVGTHIKPFNRLLKKVDELIERGEIRGMVVAQTGNSTYKPKHYSGKPFFNESERNMLIKNSKIIITQAGAGSIIDSLLARKPTIVVPRLKRFGEHTDDHQIELAEAFGKEGKVITVLDMAELLDAIAKAKKLKPHTKGSGILAERLGKYLESLSKV